MEVCRTLEVGTPLQEGCSAEKDQAVIAMTSMSTQILIFMLTLTFTPAMA